MKRRGLSSVAALRLGLGVCASVLVFWLILRFLANAGGVRLLATFQPAWAVGAVLLMSAQIAVVALRWALFARELGAELGYGTALGAYYVSVFLNQLLPLGMLGDAFRGLWHARRLAERASPARPALDAATALVLDRASGQLTLIALVLVVLPSWWAPFRASMRFEDGQLGLIAALGSVLLVVAGAFGLSLWGRSAVRRTLRARRVFLRPGALAAHGACSTAAILLHAVGFLCAARALGFALPLGLAARVVPLVLLASSLPSFALGTGAREASAAALYHLLGLRAAEGAAIALSLGLLGFVAGLPGLFVLVAARFRSTPKR